MALGRKKNRLKNINELEDIKCLFELLITYLSQDQDSAIINYNTLKEKIESFKNQINEPLQFPKPTVVGGEIEIIVQKKLTNTTYKESYAIEWVSFFFRYFTQSQIQDTQLAVRIATLIKFLLDAGGDPNLYLTNPAIYEVCYCLVMNQKNYVLRNMLFSCLSTLINKKANLDILNEKDKFDFPNVYSAVYNKDIELLTILLKKGASPNIPCSFKGQSALPFPLKSTPIEDVYPLYTAVDKGHDLLVKLLCENKAPLLQRSKIYKHIITETRNKKSIDIQSTIAVGHEVHFYIISSINDRKNVGQGAWVYCKKEQIIFKELADHSIEQFKIEKSRIKSFQNELKNAMGSNQHKKLNQREFTSLVAINVGLAEEHWIEARETALDIAISRNRSETMLLLLGYIEESKGLLDTEELRKELSHVLTYALAKCNKALLEKLIELDFDFNKRIESHNLKPINYELTLVRQPLKIFPLYAAIYFQQNNDLIECLLHHGMDPNVGVKMENSPYANGLTIAMWLGKRNIFQYLLNHSKIHAQSIMAAMEFNIKYADASWNEYFIKAIEKYPELKDFFPIDAQVKQKIRTNDCLTNFALHFDHANDLKKRLHKLKVNDLHFSFPLLLLQAVEENSSFCVRLLLNEYQYDPFSIFDDPIHTSPFLAAFISVQGKDDATLNIILQYIKKRDLYKTLENHFNQFCMKLISDEDSEKWEQLKTDYFPEYNLSGQVEKPSVSEISIFAIKEDIATSGYKFTRDNFGTLPELPQENKKEENTIIDSTVLKEYSWFGGRLTSKSDGVKLIENPRSHIDEYLWLPKEVLDQIDDEQTRNRFLSARAKQDDYHIKAFSNSFGSYTFNINGETYRNKKIIDELKIAGVPRIGLFLLNELKPPILIGGIYAKNGFHTTGDKKQEKMSAKTIEIKLGPQPTQRAAQAEPEPAQVLLKKRGQV